MHSTMTLDMLNNEVLIQFFCLYHKLIPQLLIVGTLEGYPMKETDLQIVLYMPHCSPGKIIISYLKKCWAFMYSPKFHFQLVNHSVGITSSCSLLAFPLSVSLVLLQLHCFWSSLS